MKQLYEEISKIYKWCFCCPHTDLMRELESKDVNNKQARFSSSPSYLYAVSRLLEKSIRIEYNDESEEIKKQREWDDWDEQYNSMINDTTELYCPYLRKKELKLDIDREFILPSDDKEMLRLLDLIAGLYFDECVFNRSKHLKKGAIFSMMRKAIAKIDFALIEQGKDYGKLMREMYFPYYERKTDIHECGYSWDLIGYYMKKHNISLLSNEEYDMMDTSVQKTDFNNTIEYNDAYKDGKCDINGELLVTKAEYTRYATEKYNIKSSYKHEWTRFNNIFTDNKGKTISYKSFMQSYRDQNLSSM